MTVDPHRVVLNWNVWGLNNPARCQVVRDLVVGNACTIVCLQETKLQEVNDLLIGSTLEQEFVDQYVVFPMDGTRGGSSLLVPRTTTLSHKLKQANF
jgi:exonuclease III